MKILFSTLGILSSANLWGNSTPIEPVLVPLANQTQNINIKIGKYEAEVSAVGIITSFIHFKFYY